MEIHMKKINGKIQLI